VRDINGSIEAGRITILLADRKECLIIEIKDDTKDNLYEAAGLSIYSDSKSIVSSYLSIFERLWKQSELYEQLKAHDKMQEEFINIAAHELRTPIQPILGLAEHISSRIKEGKIGPKEQNDLLNVVIRNARRLQQLTEDILDVTRIEGKSLKLRKEQFSLNDVILGIIQNHRNIIQETGSNIKLLYRPLLEEETVVIEADKARISQVISNLINNAVMFTKEGIISIEVKKKKSEDDVDDNNDKEEFIVVSVKDSGIGIDSDIEARLFSKFSTKSYHGTGLGLYISKNIVDAHGGRIWAENNPKGGATFSFTLPINK
ncbi:MAG TPA: HAMP domain-containing sensor histidine kinase, partial [Nitrososphaeraceae archaeon]